MSEILLEAKNVKKTYGQGEAACCGLDDVSMVVHAGEFLVILGESGSGKSTLLNMLGGMDKVDEGQILFEGSDITRYNRRELTTYRKDKIGFVYQSFNLLSDLNVLQNVMVVPGASKHKDRALDLLKQVGLEGKEDKFPRQLSGGQQQRVAIARALNKDAKVLLCDEPTGSLDARSGQVVLSLLSRFHKQGTAIVIVTHAHDIAAMAERVYVMRDAKIVDEYRNENPIAPAEVDW